MIQKLIDEALQKEQDERKDRKRSGKYSPSLFGRCYRMQYWNRLDEPISDPLDARTLRKFKVGKIFHDFVEKLLPNHDVEVKVENEDILGFADVVTENRVMDLKSAHTNDFRRFWSKDYDIFKGKETNWLQVATYAWILKKPECGLCFIGKDDLCIEEYFSYTEKWIPKIEEEVGNLKKWWLLQELPPAEPRAYNGKECSYCGYQTKCKGDTK